MSQLSILALSLSAQSIPEMKLPGYLHLSVIIYLSPAVLPAH
jgi:hypothetical protein